MSSGTRAVSVVLVGITHHGWQECELQKSSAFCEPLIVVAAFVSNAEFNGQVLAAASTSTIGSMCYGCVAWKARRQFSLGNENSATRV
jgi:hypothetical protein